MGKLFGQRAMPPIAGMPASNNLNFNIQNDQDPVNYAEEMIKRSGGDAKAAFYLACKEKGVDADSFIKRLSSMGNTQGLIQNLLLNNPRAQSLFSLFSSAK